MVDYKVESNKTALIIVDLQNLFVEGYSVSPANGPDILDKLNKLAEICREHGIQVIHTAHVLRPDGSNIGTLAEMVPSVREGHLYEGAVAAELHPDLVVKSGDIVLNKPRFGAFQGTDLEMILRSNGIDTTIIGGISTNVCCETTAREANARDFKVLFLSDGTATSGAGDLSAEEVQRASCSTLARVFAQVLTINEVTAKISEAVLVR